MDTYQIEILDPKAKRLLEDLASMNLITVQPLEPRKAFKRLVEKLRSTNGDTPSLDEITAEVEAVRTERHARQIDDQGNPRHESLD